MLKTFSWLAAACAALCLTTASALGLGEIDVRSKLNQRLYAVIPLSSMTADEAEAAIIGLGSSEDFSRYGIERTEFMSSLRFAVSNEGGNPRIVVTSAVTAREPYLSFLVEVRTRSSRSLREYTVLLDPPDMPAPAPAAKPAPAAAAAPGQFYETPEEQQRRLSGMNKPATIAPAPAAKPAPFEAQPLPPPAEASAAPAAPVMDAAEGPSTYGPVAQKETLWSIGTKIRPDASISMDQVLLALYKANPKSFEGFNGLRKGSTLKVPTAAEMRAVSASAAKARVNELRGMSAPAPKAPMIPAEVPVIPVPPPPPAAASPDLPPIPATKPKPAAPVAVPPPPPAAAKPLPPPPAVKPLPPPPPPPIIPKADNKPLLPPPPAAKPLVPPPPPPAVSAAPQPATPAVSVPPPPPPPVAGATATPPPAPAAGVEEPLIPPAPATPPPAEITPPQPVTPPPALEEPVEEESNNTGLYLFLVVMLAALGAGGFFGYKRWKEQQGGGGGGGGEKKSFIPSSKLRKKAAEAGTSFEDSEPDAAATQPARAAPSAPPASQGFDQRMDSGLGETGGQPAFSGGDFDATMTGETAAASFDSTATMALATGQTQAYSSTQAIDSTQSRTAQNSASVTQTSAAERLDFDVTSQFAAETMSINLDANDPVSEADFHLAYGLYDEAALLLKQAADKDPGRTDVRVKLAETYFAASRPNDFRDVAAGLQMQLPEAEWQKLAIMGAQLLPDDPLFAGAGDAGLGSDIDLAFDEPVTPSASAAAPAAAPAAHDVAADFGSLDFKLEELELPKLEEPKLDMPSMAMPAAAPAAPAPRADAPLEFKLDAPAAHTPNFSSTAVGFNANATSEVAAAKPQKLDFSIDDSMSTVALNTGDGDADVRLDDFDLNEASTAISSGDEASTKLDLARAYADMGDNDMARTLLKEVVEQGNPAQQKEAQALMGRLA